MWWDISLVYSSPYYIYMYVSVHIGLSDMILAHYTLSHRTTRKLSHTTLSHMHHTHSTLSHMHHVTHTTCTPHTTLSHMHHTLSSSHWLTGWTDEKTLTVM